jgi:hypothetical protein
MLRVDTQITGTVGGPFFSTNYFNGNTQGVADDASAAVRTFWNAIQANMLGPATITVQDVVTQVNITTGDPEAIFSVTNTAITLGGSGTYLPWGIQAVCNWRTGVFVGGREIRGKTYIPLLTEGNNTNGYPDSSLLGTVNTAMAALIADAGNELVVWSKKNGIAQPVVSGAMSQNWGLLHSRKF